MSKFRCMFVMLVVLCVGSLCFGEEMIYLSGGTVVADTYYECAPAYAWYGESVTELTIGTIDFSEGENQYIEVSGKITGISDPRGCWVEIGLVPKKIWKDWQEWGEDGECRSAVFNKGLYIVHWFDDAWALGACLQEGWEVGYYTYTETGPSFWPLNHPSRENPWEFSISMFPDDGEAYVWFDQGHIDSEEPFVYGNNDYSECYLIARIWSDDIEGAEFSFKHVRAQVLTIE